MCAIFGSNNFEDFKHLYKINLDRGNSAFGMLVESNTRTTAIKLQGVANFDKEIPDNAYVFLDFKIKNEDIFYAGHTQAPTSTAQNFDIATSHPFMYMEWVVAHNGVLTNYEELSIGLDCNSYNIVDSSIIPSLLVHTKKQNHSKTEKDVLVEVLGKLKGTYSLWIYNKISGNFYIARCGSTLFVSKNNKRFSSVQDEDMISVEDASLYERTLTGFNKCGSFNNNSPFFIL